MGEYVGETKRGTRTKIMAVADRHGLPVAVCAASATPHEVTLVTATLAELLLYELPTKLIGDRAYDSDDLDAELALADIEMIAPNRKNRCQAQDGRPLHRYQRRWLIKRLFS